jgi:beta-alanine degradation protein BauB
MKTRRNIFLRVSASLVIVGGLMGSASVLAEDVPPSYVASPDVYKLISENENFRVIEATWKPGQKDAWHSHAGPLAAYSLTDCESMKSHTKDGKIIDKSRKAGTVTYNPVIASHSLENAGKADCKVLIVEKK